MLSPCLQSFSLFSTLCQFSNSHLLSASQEIVTPDGFDVLRRVYVDFEGINFKRKFLTGLEPDVINILIGKPFALLHTAADLTWPLPYLTSPLYYRLHQNQLPGHSV